MARETTTYKGATVSVPPGTDFYRVPFPAADFPQGTGSAHPHSCPLSISHCPLPSQKQSGGKAMSGGIHSTGFPCLNAAGCCYVPGKGIPCGGMASGQPLKAVHYGNISE